MLNLDPHRNLWRSLSGVIQRQACTLCKLLILLVCFVGVTGCASYTDNMVSAHSLAQSGRFQDAVGQINARLGVKNSGQLPENLEKEKALLLLERATLLQGLGEYEFSARDMMVADQHLNWLLLDGKTLDTLSQYLYSDDAKNYRAPAYERLLLNTLNIVNFLAIGNLEDAKVEARRFVIMESFYLDSEGQPLHPQLVALGNYLAGVAFESSRDYQSAVRFYAKSWHHGTRDDDLRRRLIALYRLTSSGTKGVQDATLDALRNEAKAYGPLSYDEYVKAFQTGDLLMVTQYGFVPYKKAVRLGATQAITMSSRSRRGSLGPQRRAQATTLIASGALGSVNFPQLSTQGLPQRAPSSGQLVLDNRREPLFLGMDVNVAVELAWQEISGTVLAAAITRAITRALAGNVGRAVGANAAKSNNSTTSTLGAIGFLASLGTEIALNAADTPDTRSWTMLPAYISLSRRTVTPGKHTASFGIAGRREAVEVDVKPDRLNLINFSRLR